MTAYAPAPGPCPCSPTPYGKGWCFVDHGPDGCPETGYGGLICNACSERFNQRVWGTPLVAFAEQAERRAEQAEAKANPLLKARRAEAMAYVAAYTGSWGLILDIRADRRYGTKYMKLTERQVDAILAGKARDEARLAEAQAIPGYDEAVALASGWGQESSSFRLAMFAKTLTGEPFSPNMVSAILRSRDPVERVPDGWYRHADDIWKVQLAVNGSGKPYAKKLVVEDGKGRWEYVPGGVSQLSINEALTLEEAEAFGQLYGVCAVCGRVLTDETSIARGIGPVCISRLG
jgi:hypothetical protein